MPLIASVIRTTAGESAHNTNHDLPLKERFSNNSLLMSRYSASLLSPLFSGCARLSAFGEASNTRRCRCLTGGLIGDTTSVPVMKGVVARTRQIPAEPQQWPAAAAQVHRAGFCDNRQSRLILRAIPLHQRVSLPLYHYNGTSLWPRASLPW